jgi:hypothetical protein
MFGRLLNCLQRREALNSKGFFLEPLHLCVLAVARNNGHIWAAAVEPNQIADADLSFLLQVFHCANLRLLWQIGKLEMLFN